MAKTKRKHLAAIAAMKESHRAQLVDRDRRAEFSPISAFDDMDTWVEVRKQKIIILIPPLPKTQEKPRKRGRRKKVKLPEAALRESSPKDSALETKREVSTHDQDKVNRRLLEAIVELGGCPTEASNGCISPREVPNDTADIQTSFGNDAVPEACPVESRSQTVSNVDVRPIKTKRKWKNRKNTRNRASRGRRKSVTFRQRENSEVLAQPMSNMDVLLASVETIHAEQMMPIQVASRIDGCELDSIQEKQTKNQPTHSSEAVIGSVKENASFDTADSSIQPKTNSGLQDGWKASLEDGDASPKQAVEPRASLCMPELMDLPRKEESNCLPSPFLVNRTENLPEREEERELLTAKTGKFPSDLDEKLLSSGSVHREERVFDGRCLLHPLLSTNQTLKVLTLKKQLEKAGGLSKWLVSVGLHQFVGAFEKRVFSECELLQLNMDDLKQMGNAAVGPRRKLIWALSHLSQQLI